MEILWLSFTIIVSVFSFPLLHYIYNATHDLVETILRVAAGFLFITHSFSKKLNPLGAVGMVENLGFYIGVFWSSLLAATEFSAEFWWRLASSHSLHPLPP